jgi:tetratricopeptide (TPR) repeat protein
LSALKKALKAKRAHKIAGTSAEMLDFLLIVQDEYQHIRRLNPLFPTALRLAVNKILDQGLQQLRIYNAEGFKLLTEFYVEGGSDKSQVNRYGLSRFQLKRKRDDATAQLADILLHKEKLHRQQKTAEIHSHLPAPKTTTFLGRQQETESIVNQLLKDDDFRTLVVCGFGGVGKTALVSHCLSKMIAYFHFNRYFWWEADDGGGQSLERVWQRFVHDVFVAFYPNEDAGITLSAKKSQICQMLQQIPTLIIIDNIESQPVIQHFVIELKAFSPPGKFLMTSRVLPALPDNIFTIPLWDLTLAESDRFLRNQSQYKMVFDDQTCRKVFSVAGGNPLALLLLGNMITKTSLDFALAGWQDGHIDPFTHIYQRTWEGLSDSSQIILLAFQLMPVKGSSLHHLQSVTELTNSKLWKGISSLLDASLLNKEEGKAESWYKVHPLTQTFVQRKISDSTLFQTQMAHLVLSNLEFWVQEISDWNEKDNSYHRTETYLIKAVEVGLTFSVNAGKIVPLLLVLFPYIEMFDAWQRWLPLFDQCDQQYNEEHHGQKIILMNRLGQLHRFNYQYKQAIAYHEKAYLFATHQEDPDLMARSLKGLSLVYLHMNDLGRAEQYCREIFPLLPAEPNKQFAETITNLSFIACEQKKWADAIRYAQEAKSYWEKANNRINTAKACNNLARAYLGSNRLSKAKMTINHGLQMLVNVPYSLEQARLQNLLGIVYIQLSEYKLALSEF